MRLQPYALSIHHFISSVGADAGFASIIGLAVLVLLYFAQARETSSLRDQAELAAQRVAQLESRLAHAVTAQPQVAPPPSGVAPMPTAYRRPGGLIPAAPVQSVPAVAAASPSPPAGVGAPPLSAATKLIPTPAVQPPVIGAPGVAAARISTPMPGLPPVAAPAAAVPSSPLGTLPSGSPSPMDRIVTPRPATAAGGATATNGTGEHAVVPPPIPLPPFPPRSAVPAGPSILGDFRDRVDGGSNDLARVLTGVAAFAVLAAIVVVLLSLTSGGSPSHSASSPSTPAVSNAPTAHSTKAKPKQAAVDPSAVTVAVLNGTPVAGLAKSFATQLGAAGYQQGTVANAATQTQPTTTVEYAAGDQRDAAAVARTLKLGSSSIQPITSDVQALACPQTTACTVNVVVTLGADESNAQTQTTTTG